MKINHSDGRLWFEKAEGRGVVVGITAEHFNATGVFWVLVPIVDDGTRVENGSIIAHYESSKGLSNLRAPFDCTLVRWNQTLLDQPDKLTPDTWLFCAKV